jgi:hypothetical protein
MTMAIVSKGSYKGQVLQKDCSTIDLTFKDVHYTNTYGKCFMFDQLLRIEIHLIPNQITVPSKTWNVNKLHTMFGHPISQVRP